MSNQHAGALGVAAVDRFVDDGGGRSKLMSLYSPKLTAHHKPPTSIVAFRFGGARLRCSAWDYSQHRLSIHDKSYRVSAASTPGSVAGSGATDPYVHMTRK